MNLWVKDPVTNISSVSLTLLVISFTGVIVAGALQMAGLVPSTGLFSEMFYTTSALYFGRRMTITTKKPPTFNDSDGGSRYRKKEERNENNE